METEKPEPEKKELTKFLQSFTFVICLGAYHYGFNLWLVHDPATLKENVDIVSIQEAKKDTEMHPALLAFTISSFVIGCLIGSLLFGPMADKCGRKGVLLVNDLFSIVSGLTLAVSKSFRAHVVFALARLFTGLSTGIFSCAVPMYLGEISPTNLRGGLVSMDKMSVSIGMLIAQVLGVPEVLGSEKGLPYLLSIPSIMAFFQFFLLLNFPESPRYLLIQMKDEEGARQALQKLRGQDDVETEMEELRQEDIYERKEKRLTILKLLRYPSLRWQLSCVVILFATLYSSGINSAYFYAGRIFLAMKIQENIVVYSSALLTFLILFPHGLSVYKMDSWGRRPLLLYGLGISIISCILLTMTLELQVIIPWMAYISSVLLLTLVTGIVIGPNSIPPLMISELFLQSTRASAYAVGSFFQWLLILLFGSLFTLLEKHIRTYSFLIFLPFCMAGFLYILKVVPETKKKTILDIRKLLEAYLKQKYLNKKPAADKKKRGKR